MTGVPIRRRKGKKNKEERTETHREEGHVKMKKRLE